MRTLLLVLATTAAAAAQGPSAFPAATPPAPPVPVYPADPLFVEPPPPPVRAATAPLPEPGILRTDVIFGLPVAVRGQMRLGETGLWGEAGGAVYLIIPSFFAGLRYEGKLHEEGRHGMFVRPGVDYYYSPLRSKGDLLFGKFNGISAIVADVDVTWRHGLGRGLDGNFSLKIGCGAGFAGSRAFPLPILGVSYGLQF